MNQSTIDFIAQHRHDDPARLALKGAPKDIDLPFALRQIEGWQTAVKKLPRWASTDGIVYPVRLSMQQCSSQSTALYKAQMVQRLIPEAERTAMADLTGGLGVDFSFLAPLFSRAWYVERDEALCAATRNNLPLLDIFEADVVNSDAESFLSSPALTGQTPPFSLIFLDPARRDGAGRKLVRIEDCQPDVSALQDRLLALAPVVMVKLSPMLDIAQALKVLRHVAEVHIVASDGECKELLIVMLRGHEGEPVLHCEGMCFTRSEEAAAAPLQADEVGGWLYIPSPAMMKAAPFHLLSLRHGIRALPHDTHLYTSPERVEGFPGRTLKIEGVCDVKTLRRLHPELEAANIIARGYPDTPEALRRRLKLRDGGDRYIVATTLPSGRRALLLCKR